MKTQLPILNVANLQNSARPATQADSFTADVPFNQVLNKEVSNRNAENQSKPNEAAKDTSPEPVKAAPAPAASTAPKSDADKAASSDDKKADDQAEDDASAATDAASAQQMLALVANMGQMIVQPLSKKTTDQDMDALAGQKGKKPIGQIGADAKMDLPLADAQGEDKGKAKNNPLDLAALQDSEKDAADGKSALPTRATTEKSQAESPVSAKSFQADLQESATAARNAKVTPEVNVKPIETPVQPTAATVIPALQQAMSLSQQAAMSGQAVQRLTPAVGSQGWDQAVGQKVLWMANGGLQSASLTLNPPDLGPLQVVLHVNNQQADATFITAQPEVKQALEAAMPKLREMMDQAGIQLGQATVNTGTPNQQQGANQQQQARSSSGDMSNFGGRDNEPDVNVAVVPRPIARGGQGLVDTFA
ncbi:flagellar hook-length control protein [Herbaspirillum hiltneri N3]|uniref:Flagellar hook-length control protein n=1 Tax=Herbaspirillum hiltneri N3 TaxID=1262470 RepID=A0ABM5V0G4_9BURK|nr:flagellar hook-length control protein FliK [Herbaspirillum hiltneri]AKZ63012.1 flagellar hook-length control protein [Herbaspirillum hiltneri N3]